MIPPAVFHSYEDSYQALNNQYLSACGGLIWNEFDYKGLKGNGAEDELDAAILEICRYAGDQNGNLLLKE